MAVTGKQDRTVRFASGLWCSVEWCLCPAPFPPVVLLSWLPDTLPAAVSCLHAKVLLCCSSYCGYSYAYSCSCCL